MARSYKQPSIVSGLSISEILEMDNETFNKLGLKDLRKVVGRLVSAGNKRLRTLQNAGYSTPATRQLERSGGAFSIKGKKLNQLRAEYIRAKQFIKSETSTKKGYLSLRNSFIEDLRKRGKFDLKSLAEESVLKRLKREHSSRSKIGEKEYNLLVDKYLEKKTKKFFKIYEKLKDMDSSVSEKAYKYRLFEKIAERIQKTPNDSVDSIVNDLYSKLGVIYKSMKEQKSVRSPSDIFEQVNDEDDEYDF